MRLFIFGVAMLVGYAGLAQNDQQQDPDWSLLLTDPNANVNEVIQLFEQHWQDREITPGSGYKPFKRWEHLMFGRTDENGFKPSVEAQLREFNHALQLKNQRSQSGNWRNLGPVLDDLTTRVKIPGVGRINHLAFHPTDPNIIFCGAPAGGLWRTYDGGQNWVSTTDDLPTLGVSAIAFDPFDPNIVYMGTGDRDANDAPGMGMMRSTDGGLTWEFTNAGFEDQTVGDVICDPENPGVVLAACRFGLRRSSDFGQTWQLVTNAMYFKQIHFKPGNSQIAYATAQGRFYRSEDNGQSWTMITNGVTMGTRFVIAVTPANPELVYICSANTFEFRALYRSTDSGLSFETMSDTPNILGWSADGSAPGGQAWFDLCMAADPVNPDRIFVGGIRMKRSDDGGATWVDIQSNFLHVDHHWCAFSPHNGELYLGNDGGIYVYRNQVDWDDISTGIVAGQIYKFGQAPITANKALTGYQDNGTMEFNGVEWVRAGGADGFECQYDPQDESTYYNSIYYGQIYRTNTEVNNQKICGEGELGINESGAWSAPWHVTEFNANKMFVGMKNLWRSPNIKTPQRDDILWERISMNLQPNNENLSSISQSRIDTNLIYVTKGVRRFFRTLNANDPAEEVTWTNLSDQLPAGGTPVTAIAAHPFDSNAVYIGFNNRIWRSDNQGANWTNVSDGLPEVRINSIVFDLDHENALYAGTDRGVYYRDGEMDEWVSFSGNLPLGVRITELEIFYDDQPQNKRLRAATYGRGLWESDLYGNETIEFPATAWLRTEQNTTECYGTFTVNAGFYRQLNNVAVEGFESEDLFVENGQIVALIPVDDHRWEVTIEPNQLGVVRLAVATEAAIDLNGVATLGSDTLKVLYLTGPEPFGYEGPGGIGNIDEIELWLRSDEGIESNTSGDQNFVAEWYDAIGHPRSASQSDPVSQPLLRMGTEGINGFPAVEFDGDTTFLMASAIPSSVDLSVFSVARSLNGQWNEHGWIASARQPNGFLIHPWRNIASLNVSVIDSAMNYASSSLEWVIDPMQPQIYGLIYGYHPEAQLLQKTINGSVFKYPATNHGGRVANQPIDVRYGWDYDQRFGHGQLTEHVIYNRRLYDSHRIILTNYLSAKYGIAVEPHQRYTRFDMAHEVAGIGMHNNYDLHTDAKGSGIVRISDPDDLDANEYLIWGHDGSDLQWVTDSYPLESLHINRLWAYEQTGNVGQVRVRVYANEWLDGQEQVGVIVNPQPQFLPGASPTYFPLVPAGDYYEAWVVFPESGVFTIGAEPVVGVENLAKAQVVVYPNPAGEAVTVNLGNIAPEGANLLIYDPAGRLVGSEKAINRIQTLSLAHYAPGMYTLVIEKEGQRQVTRFVHY